METWLACLVALLGTACVAVFGMRAYQSLRRWQRKDAVYHHGWAQSRGEFKEAQDHEAHVEDIDKKLAILREQYKAVEDGRLDDFAGVVINEGSKEK
ncbi:unnamed protein product [Durusdinium trenchii]|uniref:Uncharacterized protein n=1 Tax=Durusdinium trenchii TaxID=1381693 RepID=A0ABP0SSQ4_9DINO